ncbi:MAG TPA: VIT domain-containing protein [Thermoanaerobaculia bacterium]|nr:VIT domain-containing protein [Thermoanaerobaculia bacterium]
MKRASLLLLFIAITPSLFADGMIVLPHPDARVATPFPLSVKYHHVDVKIASGIAHTSVDQEFFNPTNARLEGTYIFPLPGGGVVSDFAMEIDGKLTRAEMLDATKARGIYEDIVRSMRDPALLEYIGKGAFKVRIFPIEPRSSKRVKLSYSEVVRSDNGLHAYTYGLNTEKFSAAPLDDVSIRVSIEADRGLKTIFCPTHEVEIRRKANNAAVVGFEAKQIKPDQDFVLYYSTDDQGVGLSVMPHHPAGEDGYFLLTVTPSYDSGGRALPKDLTFVVDTSGSMAGAKMTQAKRALAFCLQNLNPDDRFEIIRFSTDAEALFDGLTTASRANVARAQKYVDELQPIGGTNSEEALTLALKSNAEASPRPKVVIFITDGKPTIGETDEERLVAKVKRANAHAMRVFTFGVGDDLNTHFLDKLTEVTRAARTYVGERENLELPVSSFFEKIKSPVLVDVAIEYGSGLKVTQTYPRALPDLFKGSQLVVVGRYTGTGGTVTLSGMVDGRRVSIPYTASFPTRTDANELIPPLWAAQRIGYLLDEIRLHGEEKELVDEATRLARRFGVVTPYTSYLIMEDEARRVAANTLRPEHQTLNAIAPQAKLGARMKGDYDAMQKKAGAPSVQASKEVEALKNAQNSMQIGQGQSRMNYTDAKGKQQNLGSQMRNVQGRAVYQVGSNWVDSRLEATKKTNAARRIKFASAAYFELLTNEPKAAPFLALGRNVSFVLKDQVYEVFE